MKRKGKRGGKERGAAGDEGEGETMSGGGKWG